MCMDRGYGFPEVYELLLDYAYTIHIRLKTRRGIIQTQRKKKRLPIYRSRHWVVERKNTFLDE